MLCELILMKKMRSQHTIILYIIEKSSLNYPLLPLDMALRFTLRDSSYSCLEQISMVPKIFKLLVQLYSQPFLYRYSMQRQNYNDNLNVTKPFFMMWQLRRNYAWTLH